MSLHLHTSLVCRVLWLMTFINGSEQGLGPLPCCLLSPLLYSNDFLPRFLKVDPVTPKAYSSLSLSFFFPPFFPSSLTPSFTHTLKHTTFLTLTYTYTDLRRYTCTFSRDPNKALWMCVCVCVRTFMCILLGKQSLAPFYYQWSITKSIYKQPYLLTGMRVAQERLTPTAVNSLHTKLPWDKLFNW